MATQSCIVLAGGLGTRLRGVIGERPKCLALVGSRPFVDIQIDSLLAAGVDDLILSLGYGADQVIEALDATLRSKPVRYVVEPHPLGTGGAIAHVLDTLGVDETLVANGDTFLSGPIGSMFRRLDREGGELLRMALVVVADRGRFGGVNVSPDGRVEGFLEKGLHGSGLVNAGLYRLCRQALPTAGLEPFSLEADVLPNLVRRGEVTAASIDGSFTDIGVPTDYFRFCEHHGG